ncbi:MAG: DUF1840 domain-containing protein [Betaproteobacteria bacterium]|nr:DUF1840 domain-containing protein [Betaproteobacteria bacterium]MBK8919683.1 DUF1840 domain-containing protein [Betaproteobacteria bacterium]
MKFISSETGELIMFAEVARQLLLALGKPCAARGAFTVEEMAAAAAHLRALVDGGASGAAAGATGLGDEEDEPPVSLGSRAWPFIDMLERTARGGSRANIVWEAPGDFSA